MVYSNLYIGIKFHFPQISGSAVLASTIRHGGVIRNCRAEAIPLPHVLLPTTLTCIILHSTLLVPTGNFCDSCNNHLQLSLAIMKWRQTFRKD